MEIRPLEIRPLKINHRKERKKSAMTRLAISNIAWDADENLDVRELLKSRDISGLEVAPGKLFQDPLSATESEIQKQKAFWTEAGIQPVAMQSLLFGHPELTLFESVENRERTRTYLEQIITLAAKLGVGPLVFGSPKNRQRGAMDEKAAFDVAVRFFQALGEFSARQGVMFCIEPNAKEYGCDFIQNTGEALALVKAVDSPGFGLHMDAGVLTLNQEPYEKTLEAVFPWICHFHISEPFLKPVSASHLHHGTLGQILNRLGYDRWVSIEMLTEPGPERMRILSEAVDTALSAYGGRSCLSPS